MHWIPKAFHSRISQQFRGISPSILEATDPLESSFHKVLHGKGGTVLDAYNDRVKLWLDANLRASIPEFLAFIEKLKSESLELYQQYLTGG